MTDKRRIIETKRIAAPPPETVFRVFVALLGRMNLVGVLLAGLGLSGLTIGLDVAERTYDLPSSLTGLLQALIIIFVVLADAIAGRIELRRP